MTQYSKNDIESKEFFEILKLAIEALEPEAQTAGLLWPNAS